VPALVFPAAWPAWPPPPRAIFGFAFVAMVSTIFAFWLQIRAQRVLDASLSSLIFLLESPAAAIFGFLLLAERLSTSAWIGAAMMLSATALAVRIDATRSDR